MDGKNDDGFGSDRRIVEGEEDRMKEGRGLVAGILLEFGVDIDDEGRADGREETGLRDKIW